jgi:hypothetical protein
MALLYLLNNWDADLWAKAMRRQAPDLDVRVWPKETGRIEDITYAVAWLPPANVLRSLPHLKVIFSLGAGVDAILKDPTLPDGVPIARVIDPDLTMRMSEYVVMNVLMHHRQQRRMDENQRNRIWDCFPTHAARTVTVGIMGLGVMGQDSARKLASMGFKVVGWSRTRKNEPTFSSASCRIRRKLPASSIAMSCASSRTRGRSAAQCLSMPGAASSRSRVTYWPPSMRVSCSPLLSMCSKPSPCPRTAGSGAILRSRSHRMRRPIPIPTRLQPMC